MAHGLHTNALDLQWHDFMYHAAFLTQALAEALLRRHAAPMPPGIGHNRSDVARPVLPSVAGVFPLPEVAGVFPLLLGGEGPHRRPGTRAIVPSGEPAFAFRPPGTELTTSGRGGATNRADEAHLASTQISKRLERPNTRLSSSR